MNVSQYMPFFLTGFFPCFLVLIGMWMDNKRFNTLEKKMDDGFNDLKSQIRHFIDISMDHGERIATLEERTGGKKKP